MVEGKTFAQTDKSGSTMRLPKMFSVSSMLDRHGMIMRGQVALNCDPFKEFSARYFSSQCVGKYF